jgi:hypothetical protein
VAEADWVVQNRDEIKSRDDQIVCRTLRILWLS